MANTIEAVGLEKSFVKKRAIDELVRHPFRRAQRIQALRGVDLSVAEGEIFGLLGPNGAGKTTLLKILSCLVLPDRGRAVVGGNDTIHEYDVKRKIGVKAIYDLSATPFFLRGSGYPEGTLFPWVVSDFSLIDAIEILMIHPPPRFCARETPVPVGQRSTQAGSLPSASRWLQNSHLLILPKASSKSHLGML